MNFSFSNPTKLIFGDNTVGQIGQVIAESGCNRVLLLAGGGSIKKNNTYENVLDSLQQTHITVVECWGVRANPELMKVREAIDLAREHDVRAVLAVGGGSVIDTAKAVAAGVYLEDIWQAFEWKEKITKALPIFTVLTLSATASEMNCNAVITNEQESKKWGIGNPLLYPKVSIIDPSIQASLPWQQTANGAIDALAHIMEYYFMGTVEETAIAINEALMKTIIAMTDKLQVNSQDSVSRANLAWAVTLGLNGISGAGLRGGDWACHMIEHSVSCIYPEVAHGAGLGVIFPAWLQYVYPENPTQFQRFANNIWQCSDIVQAPEKMKQKIKSWQAPTHLREFGIAKDKLSDIADNAASKGSLGRLKKLDKQDIETILHLAY